MRFSLRDRDLGHGPVTVLHGVTLAIEAGEKVALLGPSGVGKSTLLAVLRAQQPHACAWCPQDGALVPMLSVFHNIYMGALERHNSFYNLLNLIRPLPSQRQAVTAVAEPLGLSGKLFTSVDRLSGGQAQRTALGRALFAQRPVLLADEPVSGVDEHQAHELLQHALAAHETAVVALHHRELALACCDRVIGLADGRVALDAPSAQLTPTDLDPLYR